MKRKRTDKPTYHELSGLGIVSRAYASELAAGKKLPSLAIAQQIEAALGYPAGAWKIEERAA